jgi:molybdenum cofactor guanylyltransferase
LATNNSITGIVIAGGSGKRFGKNKALIEINNKPLVKLVIEDLSKVVDQVIVVTSAGQYDSIAGTGIKDKIILDIIPGKAAMGGVYTGLISSNSFYSIVVACDMPLLSPELLKYMISVAPGNDAVVPRIGEYIEPLHAVYSKDCIPHIKDLLDGDELSFHTLMATINTRYVSVDEIEKYDPGHLSMFNINTVADLERIKKVLAVKE